LRCQSVNQLLHELYVKEIRTTRKKKTVKEEKKRTKDGIQRATGKLMGIRMVIMTRMKRAEGRDLGQKGSRKEVCVRLRPLLPSHITCSSHFEIVMQLKEQARDGGKPQR
jgi:hypothetical protein